MAPFFDSNVITNPREKVFPHGVDKPWWRLLRPVSSLWTLKLNLAGLAMTA